MADSNILTQATALYAALLSSALGGWTLLKDWRDTGRLKVTVGFRSLFGDGVVEENILVYHITNVGRRSVMLTHVAGQTNKADKKGFSSFLVNDPQLPKRLEPGDYHMSLWREYKDCEMGLSRMFAIDSLGRNFSAPRKEIDVVSKMLAELGTKGITQSSTRPARSGGQSRS